MTTLETIVLLLALVTTTASNHKPTSDNALNSFKMVETKNTTKQMTVYDEIYNPENDIKVDIKKRKEKRQKDKYMREFNVKERERYRQKRNSDDERCEGFMYNKNDNEQVITHPHSANSSTYYNNSNCVTIISTTEGKIITLSFIHIFRIEYHSDCSYDYLEIRDGRYGYSDVLAKVCGNTFPDKIKTTGPDAWLKFHSDDTIEYEGFKINVEFIEGTSHSTPSACYKQLKGEYGIVDSKDINGACFDGTTKQHVDFLWTIITPPNTKIYLNFTSYHLAKPNECEYNVIQVFGYIVEMEKKLAHYCGSMAYSVQTNNENGDPGNIMNIRLHLTKEGRNDTSFNATYVAYITLDPNKDDKCGDGQFDCADNTCISEDLKCDEVAHCRLKTDEDKDITCLKTAQSELTKPHIMMILIIFSLILSGMSFVFLFKCIRKLYRDHKIIKEHLRQSCEDRLDRLDTLVGSRLTLDAKRLHEDSLPRASLERENHTNEMYKQQRSHSKHKQSSIDSDYIQETQLDLEEPWRREVDSVPESDNSRERNGRTRNSDLSKKEEYIRSKKKESEIKEKREIRDVSVGAPDTKESGCQTRESLFQSEPAPSSDGSGTNSRGFSTFGYSGGTVVRPSPPTKTSEITIELMKPKQESAKPQKKVDRRPISTETTRSAPDVIIVSKPVR